MHTPNYLRLEKNDQYTACHPRYTTSYILRVVPITTPTHDRRKSVGKKNKEKKKKIKGRKGKKAKKRKRKEKTKRQEKQEKTRQ